MTFRQVARNRVHLQVADQLRIAILARDLRPGAPLPSERELTETFAVGRIIVRAALRSLEASGNAALHLVGSVRLIDAAGPRS